MHMVVKLQYISDDLLFGWNYRGFVKAIVTEALNSECKLV